MAPRAGFAVWGVRPALRQPPVELVLRHNGVSTIQRLAAACQTAVTRLTESASLLMSWSFSS
jgi:hypothetical protein